MSHQDKSSIYDSLIMSHQIRRFPQQNTEKLMIITKQDLAERTSKQQPMRNTFKVSITHQKSKIRASMFQKLFETPPGG